MLIYTDIWTLQIGSGGKIEGRGETLFDVFDKGYIGKSSTTGKAL